MLSLNLEILLFVLTLSSRIQIGFEGLIGILVSIRYPVVILLGGVALDLGME